MKTIERLLVLWIFLAAIGACLNACGGADCPDPPYVACQMPDGGLGVVHAQEGCVANPRPECPATQLGAQ